MPANDKPRCPVCNRKGEPIGPDLFRCKLGHMFDDTPDEGGTYHSDPTRRIENADEIAAAKRFNLSRRPQAASGFRMPRSR